MNVYWTQAPEGATHYLPEQPHLDWRDCWYKKIGNDWWLAPCEEVLAGHWRWSIDNVDVEIFEPLLISRPTPKDVVEVLYEWYCK